MVSGFVVRAPGLALCRIEVVARAGTTGVSGMAKASGGAIRSLVTGRYEAHGRGERGASAFRAHQEHARAVEWAGEGPWRGHGPRLRPPGRGIVGRRLDKEALISDMSGRSAAPHEVNGKVTKAGETREAAGRPQRRWLEARKMSLIQSTLDVIHRFSRHECSWGWWDEFTRT